VIPPLLDHDVCRLLLAESITASVIYKRNHRNLLELQTTGWVVAE